MDDGSNEQVRQRVNADGISRHFGIVVEEVRDGYARAKMSVPTHGDNFLGVPHGATIFALADQAFAAASNSRGLASVALQVSVNFTRMPAFGEELVAEANEVHTTRRTGVYHVAVRGTGGELVAHLQGTVFRTSKKLSEFEFRPTKAGGGAA
ncbi:MAG: hydroxyphenylacetyl-CoA thioesterase PaaI [Promethearchaeota archaeon]